MSGQAHTVGFVDDAIDGSVDFVHQGALVVDQPEREFLLPIVRANVGHVKWHCRNAVRMVVAKRFVGKMGNITNQFRALLEQKPLKFLQLNVFQTCFGNGLVIGGDVNISPAQSSAARWRFLCSSSAFLGCFGAFFLRRPGLGGLPGGGFLCCTLL